MEGSCQNKTIQHSTTIWFTDRMVVHPTYTKKVSGGSTRTPPTIHTHQRARSFIRNNTETQRDQTQTRSITRSAEVMSDHTFQMWKVRIQKQVLSRACWTSKTSRDSTRLMSLVFISCQSRLVWEVMPARKWWASMSAQVNKIFKCHIWTRRESIIGQKPLQVWNLKYWSPNLATFSRSIS